MHIQILNLLEKFNPSIKELFMAGNKFSITGLLNAALMTGDATKGIAKTCLKYLAKERHLEVSLFEK